MGYTGEKDRAGSKEKPHGLQIALFIDGGNLSKGIDALGIRESQEDLDFEKLVEWVKSGGGDLAFATYYFSGRQLLSTKETRKFLVKLRYLGITTRSVSEDQPDSIGSVMATDMISQASHYDRAVLVSTKDYFAEAIKQITGERKKVTVVSPWVNIPKSIVTSGAQILFLTDILPGMTMRRIPIPQRLEMESHDLPDLQGEDPITVFEAHPQPNPAT